MPRGLTPGHVLVCGVDPVGESRAGRLDRPWIRQYPAAPGNSTVVGRNATGETRKAQEDGESTLERACARASVRSDFPTTCDGA